jgi:hypothetical protein
MKFLNSRALALSSLVFLVLTALPIRAHDANAEMTAAAVNFLAALTPEQKTQATFDFSGEERLNWHFIPRPRKGLPIKDMTSDQRLLAQALLVSGLSGRGYAKAVSIMSLDAVLKVLEEGKKGAPMRDPDNYYVSIFGTPGAGNTWGWRFEGHHLSLNYTLAGDADPTMTPSFFGTNPAEVRTGPRTGTRVLAAEEDLGRELVKSLTEDQRKLAVLPVEVPKDILNDPKRVDPTNPEGLPQSQFTAEQTATLVKLIKEYLFRCRPDVAADDWAKVEKAGLDKIHFAWAGGFEPGQPHYYRVQGGHFVLELDNTQNDANHVHSIWRDFDHDFGVDLLKAHLEAAHTGK